MRSIECWNALALVFLTGAVAFRITEYPRTHQEITQTPRTHQEITQTAVLDAVVRTCRNLAEVEGRAFSLPPSPLTVARVIGACDAAASTKSFLKAIREIQTTNKRVDIRHKFDAEFHFDGEKFEAGRGLITDGLDAIKASNRRGNFVSAREKLGEITHSLQDFYSHSNWVELGNVKPNQNLMTAATQIGNIDLNRHTCQKCVGKDCTNNIREDIIQDQILTSGYFGLLSSSKPAGKCSHGGVFDQTRNTEPTGGINKDGPTAEHGHAHHTAARLATAATIELLDDIRGAAGNTDFLRMLGISKGSSRALCFVIDSTGSMGDDIAAVKSVTAALVDGRVGTPDEPSLYLLVLFSDPDFGPLMTTTDPNVFKAWLSNLTAAGGGDYPELALSGLQLALTGAPSGSEVFLFTDGIAKDLHLTDTVLALMERTKTVVNFMLTGPFQFSFRRRQEVSGQSQAGPTGQMSSAEAQLFTDLAHASGGQAIHVKKSHLSEAMALVTETSAASLVTLLQAVRSPGRDETFSFSVDESVGDLTAYITGRVLKFTLTSPSVSVSTGVSQTMDCPYSSLATETVVGNFRTLRMIPSVGVWEIMLLSADSYSLKIVGRSGIDVLFDFVQFFQGASEGFDVVENRPAAGGSLTLLLTLTSDPGWLTPDPGSLTPDPGWLSSVRLVEAAGWGGVNGTLEALGGGDFLARFDSAPSGGFVVLVTGRAGGTGGPTTAFQRQLGGRFRASGVAITTSVGGGLEPGGTLSVPFRVESSGAGGHFTIQASNDRGFASAFPSLLPRDRTGSARGTGTLRAPPGTPSGTAVTLTLRARAPGGNDTNHLVLRFPVVTKVTDHSRPVCQVTSLRADCPSQCSQCYQCSQCSQCSQSTWEMTANLTDGDSLGRPLLSLQRGNGTLTSSRGPGGPGGAVTLVSYTASCCSPHLELVATDEAGNVGTCFSSRRTAGTPTQGTPTAGGPTPETPTPETPALLTPTAWTSSDTTTAGATATSGAAAAARRPRPYYLWQAAMMVWMALAQR
ncbi:von Willebrand factor A domain-containing protein 7-like [Gadus chalcogrammus]|uniref:von Willebrand factor A domain-containing protein 7-like n=1 Tax=Gadus chalcogrammus TaxID=1042646 RepID=UPI0024C37DF6|nr:von Willebrand factor A domain-containing protein 7-like [Gadus chalcogrammus]